MENEPPLEMTAEMLGEAMRIPKDHATSLIKFGEQRGWVSKLGFMPGSKGRGRGATIYKIPRDLGAKIGEVWAKGWWPKE